jgi:hypothetical protein
MDIHEWGVLTCRAYCAHCVDFDIKERDAGRQEYRYGVIANCFLCSLSLRTQIEDCWPFHAGSEMEAAAKVIIMTYKICQRSKALQSYFDDDVWTEEARTGALGKSW